MVNKPRIQAEGSIMVSMHIFVDGGLVAGIEKNDNALCRRDILDREVNSKFANTRGQDSHFGSALLAPSFFFRLDFIALCLMV
jgi:hypothetical protein